MFCARGNCVRVRGKFNICAVWHSYYISLDLHCIIEMLPSLSELIYIPWSLNITTNMLYQHSYMNRIRSLHQRLDVIYGLYSLSVAVYSQTLQISNMRRLRAFAKSLWTRITEPDLASLKPLQFTELFTDFVPFTELDLLTVCTFTQQGIPQILALSRGKIF